MNKKKEYEMKQLILSILLIFMIITSSSLSREPIREIKLVASGGVTIFPLLGFFSVTTTHEGNKTTQICKYPGLTSSDIDYFGIARLEDFDKLLEIDMIINQIKQNLSNSILVNSGSKVIKANDSEYRIEYQYFGKNFRNFELEIKVFE